MIEHNLFEIKKYDFNQASLAGIDRNLYVNGLWPLVYILSDGNIKEAYVGETTDALSRMSTHLKNDSKSRLTAVRLITSDKFNKSATLDIESNLIKYMAGDGQYKLLNGNLGLANHTYYQKNEVYWDMFKTIWGELNSEGITRNSLDQINNSDLFKYSPYKSLSAEQKTSLISIIKTLLNKKTTSIIVEGGAGTGKTILAVFLFKLFHSDIEDLNLKEFGEDEKEFIDLVQELKFKYPSPKMALVIPMAGFRKTLKRIFINIKGLSAQMVIGPAEVANGKFDILVVDESHRLRKRTNLGAYFGAFDRVNKRLGLNKSEGNELDWVLLQSKKSILFYDEKQSIKPSDVDKKYFDKVKLAEGTVIQALKSQFRVRGGNDYVTYVDKLLNCQFRKSDNVFDSNDYDFLLFDSLEQMIEKIKNNDKEFGLSRLVAGYSWKWVSRDTDMHDIEIDNIKLKWNSVTDDFINSKNAINEVGCIHTTQGYDLNYTGVIFGKEISYDTKSGTIYIKRENYFDQNGQNGITDPAVLHAYIINIYKTLMLRGIKGTYVYVCDPDLREYFKKHICVRKGEVVAEEIRSAKISPYMGEMINIPLFDSVGCGDLWTADPTIQEMIPVKAALMPKGSKYFALRTRGDSMNQAGIEDGDIVLCRKDYHPENGDNVVALIGDDATIKEYQHKGAAVILKPHSNNPRHKPMTFTDNEEMKVLGVVICAIESED